MSLKNELDVFYNLFKQHLNGVQKATLRWVVCESIDWEDGTMVATDDDGLKYNEVMLGSGSVIIKPVIQTDCLIAIVHGHEEMTFLITANEVDQVVYNGGENGGLINIETLSDNMNSLKTFIESIHAALPGAFAAIGTGVSANGPAGATSYSNAMTGKTIQIGEMEDSKIVH